MSTKKYSVMFARFPQGRCDDPDVTDWLVTTVVAAKFDPRIGKITRFRRDDTPITMGRNEAVSVAADHAVDFLVMVDSDMSPDYYLADNPNAPSPDANAKPFWDSSIDFVIQQREAGTPCVVAAPYCGPPPHENVYVFLWDQDESGSPQDCTDIYLSQYPRMHAIEQRGIKEVAALPTGLIIIDMQVIEAVQPPIFYYEYSDRKEIKKESTEDVTFTRDLSFAGIKQYCNWDAWAGHWKRKCVGRPEVVSVGMVANRFKAAVLKDYNINPYRGEELIFVGERNGEPPKIPKAGIQAGIQAAKPNPAGQKAKPKPAKPKPKPKPVKGY
jgi:hypothetical protein